MDKYIDMKISLESKTQLQEMLANYYNRHINDLLFSDTIDIPLPNASLQEWLIEHEKSILFCLDFFFKEKKVNRASIVKTQLVNPDIIIGNASHSELVAPSRKSNTSNQSIGNIPHMVRNNKSSMVNTN